MNLISLSLSASDAVDSAPPGSAPPTKVCPRCGNAALIHAARCEACGRVYKTQWTPDPTIEAVALRPEASVSPLVIAPPEMPVVRVDGDLSFFTPVPSLPLPSVSSVRPMVAPTDAAPRLSRAARIVSLSVLLLLALWWLFPPVPRATRPARIAVPPLQSAAPSALPVLGPHDRPAFVDPSSVRSEASVRVPAVGAASVSVSAAQASSDAVNTKTAFPTLIGAIQSGSWKQVNAALNRGENVNQEDGSGTSALMWAVYMEWPEAVRLLLRRGARPNVRNDNDMSALDYATEQDEIARLLRKTGARDEEPEVRSGRRAR